MARVKLLRQLDGRMAGAETTYPDKDAERLAERGIVEIINEAAAAAEAAAAEAAAAEAAAAAAASAQQKTPARRSNKKG